MPNVIDIEEDIFTKIKLISVEQLVTIRQRVDEEINHHKKYLIKKSWLIQSLFGIKIDYSFLSDNFVENLFENADFEFYHNQDKTILFSQKTELLEHDFGHLDTVSALDAFKLYGLETLEKAKEKVYIKVKINA